MDGWRDDTNRSPDVDRWRLEWRQPRSRMSLRSSWSNRDGCCIHKDPLWWHTHINHTTSEYINISNELFRWLAGLHSACLNNGTDWLITRLIDWLIDLFGWSIDWLIISFIHSLHYFNLSFIDRLIHWSIDKRIYRITDLAIDLYRLDLLVLEAVSCSQNPSIGDQRTSTLRTSSLRSNRRQPRPLPFLCLVSSYDPADLLEFLLQVASLLLRFLLLVSASGTSSLPCFILPTLFFCIQWIDSGHILTEFLQPITVEGGSAGAPSGWCRSNPVDFVIGVLNFREAIDATEGTLGKRDFRCSWSEEMQTNQ